MGVESTAVALVLNSSNVFITHGALMLAQHTGALVRG
jgi:hypothetical protein